MSEQDPDHPYYFESDHVALKENADYSKLLCSISILEAQRQQAAQDLQSLYKARKEALADPLQFVERLQKGEHPEFATPQKIATLPEIQWDKYTSTASFSSFGLAWHKTRLKKQQEDGSSGNVGDAVQKLKSSLMGVGQSQGSASGSSSPSAFNPGQDRVRGRTRDSSKPASFNQLWTAEEQQRLESLLVQFPPEEVEARRWAKIANALGNRTPIQVASRVQKYFLTLAKEGLPVPGRMPNINSYSKKGSHRHHRFNRIYYSSSTMLTSHTPPVWMDEPLDNEQLHYGLSDNDFNRVGPSPTDSGMKESSPDDTMLEGLMDEPEYKELMELQKLKREKLQEDSAGGFHHLGYKCDNCSADPIVGVRWHCIDCPLDLSYDFCDRCSAVTFQDGKHNSTHRLQPVKCNTLDSDYMSYTNSKSNYNYLDSNYMPST